jgi:TPR repeat protein
LAVAFEAALQAPLAGQFGPHDRGARPAQGRRSLKAQGKSGEWLAEAKRYLDANDHAKALSLLQKAVEADNPETLNQLGELYWYGRGVDLDYAKARESCNDRPQPRGGVPRRDGHR